MKGLLIKDYMMLKKQKLILLLLVFYAILAPFMSTFAWYGMAVLMSALFPISLMAWDEKAKSDRYFLAMPYTRNDIVRAKYVFGVFVILATAVFCFVAAAAASIFKPGLDFSAAAFTIAAVTVLAVILQALCYPFVFKVGVEKGRITSFLTIGLVVAACAFLLASSDGGSNGLLNKIMNAGSSLNSLLLVLAAAILWYLSMTLSMVFYNKREL